MRRQPTLVVIANCQARPLINLLQSHFEVDCLDPIIVHLAKDEEVEQYRASFNAADIVISQAISDQYPCEAVRTSELKKHLGDRLILIPNLFYRGYTPDLRYVRLKGQPTLTGPLGDYHSSIILNAWKNGLNQNDAVKSYQSEANWEILYRDTAQKSIEELRLREQTLDIRITDYIEREQNKQQLFFTFNHPSKHLLEVLAKKIGHLLNLIRRSESSVASMGEPLDRFKAPLHSFTKRQLCLQFEGPKHFCGVDINNTGSARLQQFTLDDIVKSFYWVYEQRKGDILTLGNLTPPTKNIPLIVDEEPKPIVNIETASSLFSRLKFEDCLKQSQDIIKKEPSHLRAHCLALQACQHLEDPTAVQALIQSGLNNIQKGRQMFLVPAFDVCAHFELGLECQRLSNAMSTIAFNNNNPELAIYEARAFEILGKPKKALKQARSLREKFPEHPVVLLELIRLFKKTRQYNKAFQIIQDLTTQCPQSWEGHDQLCEELLRRNKPIKAKRCMQAAIAKETFSDGLNPQVKNLSPLRVLQYFTNNPKMGSNPDVQNHRDLINQKIALQWNTSLNNDGIYQLLNRSSAKVFLEENYNNSVVEAFLKCGPPAMQADVIRVAHLAHFSHALYIDWPYRPASLKLLLTHEIFRDGKSLLAGKQRPAPRNSWSIWNGFGYTTPENDLRCFFRTILDQMVHNINNEESNNVFWVTGPGLWGKIYKNFDFSTMNLRTIDYPQDLHPVFQPALNKRPSMKGHWSVVQTQESIYNQNTSKL